MSTLWRVPHELVQVFSVLDAAKTGIPLAEKPARGRDLVALTDQRFVCIEFVDPWDKQTPCVVLKPADAVALRDKLSAEIAKLEKKS